MAKIYKNPQFIVTESTNSDGDSWEKDSFVFLDDVKKIIKKYDTDHMLYKLKGKKKLTTIDFENIIQQAGANSDDKILIKIKNHKGMDGFVPDPEVLIKQFDSNEVLDDVDTEYFIIQDKFLREKNNNTIPGGILRAAGTNFTLHLGKKVNQYYLIILNDDLGGAGGDPPGAGVKVPSGGS